MEDSEVYGNILDHKLNPKKNVMVEAYHVAFGFPPVIFPLRYYLGKSTTNQNGKFRITFPARAYGVIGKFRVPNIELRISESFQTLYTHPVRFLVIQHTNNNFGDIILPSKFVYSDKISHVDWKEVVETYWPDISNMSLEEIAAIIPEYLELIEGQNYLKEDKIIQKPIEYRGMIVPDNPKKEDHKPHRIPWYEKWSDDQIE